MNLCYTLDLLLHGLAFRTNFKRLPNSLSLWLEVFLQAGLAYAIVICLSGVYEQQLEAARILCLLFVARAFRFMFYMTELQRFHEISETYNQFSRPFGTMVLAIYTVFFVYAIVGMMLWNGVITTSEIAKYNGKVPILYYLMNFNDFGASLVTLFHLMCVNNWFYTCDMFTLVTGTKWPRVYFISFWAIIVLVFLNIVLAVMLEIYSSVAQ